MLDPEFEFFYNSVKDPSWDDVSEYFDFVNLPLTIQDECRSVHGLDHRINEICDPNHWIMESSFVCVRDNLAFVPVTKCAYAYYTSKFTELGWTRKSLKDIDVESTNFFGFMLHPLQRYFKGLTQLVVEIHSDISEKPDSQNPWQHHVQTNWQDVQHTMKSKYFVKLLDNIVVGNALSMPYHTMFGNWLKKIHWIPMGRFGDDQLKMHAMEFCRKHGHDLSLPLQDQRIHRSSSMQIEIYEAIKNQFFNNPIQIYNFYKTFGPDLKFFYALLQKFSNHNQTAN